MIDHSIDDDPMMDAARHISAATRLVATGLAGIERERAARRAAQDGEAIAREEAKRATLDAQIATRQREQARNRHPVRER